MPTINQLLRKSRTRPLARNKVPALQKKRVSINPRTLEKVDVPEKKTINFKISKEWKNKINEKK